jgi:hypothetical protein
VPSNDKSRRANIIRKAIREGFEIPKVFLRTDLTETDAFYFERLFIRVIGRGKNGPLVNLTDGGEGITGLFWTDEHRANISRANKGRVSPWKGKTASPESRVKMSAAHKGKPSSWKGRSPSPETREKMRLAKLGRPSPNKGKVLSPEWCAAMSQARLGKPHPQPPRSEEHKAKLAAARRGKKHSEEAKARIGVARYGKSLSDEHRAAISAGHARRRAQANSE